MKIRAKKGYNVVLNDLNIALSSNGKAIEVNEEQFNSSTDAKQLIKFIDIVTQEEEKKEVKSNTLSVNKVADKAFVVGNEQFKPIGNTVLMDPNNEITQPTKKITKTEQATVVTTESNRTINNAVVVDVNNESKQLVKKAKVNKKIDEEKITKNEEKTIKNNKSEEIKENKSTEAIKNIAKEEIKDNKETVKVDNKEVAKTDNKEEIKK